MKSARAELVTEGVYAISRHPSELGLMVMGLGAPMLLGSPVGIAIWLFLLVPSTWRRVRVEDRVLARIHGVAHMHYRANTRLLF